MEDVGKSDLEGAAVADLLILCGVLATGAGLWGVVRPIERIGIANRRRAIQVVGAGLLVTVAGGALAGPTENERAAPAPFAAVPETSAPTATPPTTTTRPPTTSTPTTTVGDVLAEVAEIVDGETVVVKMPDGTEETVRLIGIDAPDSGRESRAAVKMLYDLVGSEEVKLAVDSSDRDDSGRLLRYVWVEDELVNEELVAGGFATARRYPPDTAFATRLEAAQELAQARAVGLWGTTTTTSSSTSTTSSTPTTSVAATTEAPQCHPSYVGQCVPIGVEDVDCAGGSGNGPYYTGRVQVVGYDEYRLDGNNDGIGCEDS